MLKKVLNPTDFEEERKLQVRRQVEEERKQRIFDARGRTIGIDVKGLDRQSTERNEQKNHKKEIERIWQQELLRQQAVLDMQAEIEAQRRREVAAEIQQYRTTYQLAEHRCEFDLNERRSNANDNQRTLSISSGQFFDGEDLGKAERELRQREQQRSWLSQQKEHQASAQQMRAEEQNRLYTHLKCQESYGKNMEICLENQRAKNAIMVREFNAVLAKQKSLERTLSKIENEEDNRAEIINMMASDLLNEDAGSRLSLQSNPLALDEQETYEEGRRKEVNKCKAKKITAEKKTQSEEQILLRLNAEHAKYDQEYDRRRIQLLHQLSEENLQLAKEQRQQRQLEEANSRNDITDEFFCKFNLTSR